MMIFPGDGLCAKLSPRETAELFFWRASRKTAELLVFLRASRETVVSVCSGENLGNSGVLSWRASGEAAGLLGR